MKKIGILGDIQSDPSWTFDPWTGSERRVWIG